MVQKRPFDDVGTFEISSKHPKQVEPNDPLVSFSESVFPRETFEKSHGLEEDVGQGCSGGCEKLDTVDELPRVDSNSQTAVPESFSVSSSVTSNTREEDNVSELPIHLPVFPEYFSSMSPMRTFVRCEDIYSMLLENFPRKSVAIGPNNQADVLPWDTQERKYSSSEPDKTDDDSRSRVEDGDQLILMGTCVVPFPNMRSSTYGEELGKSRTDCSCEDKGSVICVRQHISEGREKLFNSIGRERFIELGLDEMGEQVAERWSTKEEQLFHQTVYSNPVSLGKKFWNNLFAAFAPRTKKEIVNYYFNVLMIRRRAEQNRNESMSIDSDNDEWQDQNYFGDNGFGEDEDEDDEDSIVEFSVSEDGCHQQRNDLVECDEHASEDTYLDRNPNINSVSPNHSAKLGSMKSIGKCVSSSVNHLHDIAVWDGRCEKHVQDWSFTSSDIGPAVQATKVDGDRSIQHNDSNGVSNGIHEYVLESCDLRVWNTGFSSCSKKIVDFLPTCSMIEEVFGDESWDFQGKQ